MSNSGPPIRLVPVWAGKCANLNVDPACLFDFYTRYNPVLHCLATVLNAADRQSDRNRLPMLCHRRPNEEQLCTAATTNTFPRFTSTEPRNTHRKVGVMLEGYRAIGVNRGEFGGHDLTRF